VSAHRARPCAPGPPGRGNPGRVDVGSLADGLGVEARSVLSAIMRLKAAGLLDEDHRLEVGTL
ncbi:MAG TPA: hypothetical protein VJ482_06505, partial [Acidimicrobiia bacterium]|nr:hypothetical protein [Acidimicrobiia bacterium]